MSSQEGMQAQSGMIEKFKKAIELFITKDFDASLKLLEEILGEVEDPRDERFIRAFYEIIEGTKHIEQLNVDLGYQSLKSGYVKLKSYYPAYKGIYLSKFLESVEDSLIELRSVVSG